MGQVTPFMMFSERLDEAIALYSRIFPDAEVRSMGRKGPDGPVLSAEFVIGGQVIRAFEGGPYFQFSEGFSLYVDCADQAEVDRFWEAFMEAGSTPSQCGWLTDPFGVSWQIVPRRFAELIGDPDPGKVQAVTDAMLKMVKLDVAELERAWAEA